jgi:hypothetical protein
MAPSRPQSAKDHLEQSQRWWVRFQMDRVPEALLAKAGLSVTAWLVPTEMAALRGLAPSRRLSRASAPRLTNRRPTARLHAPSHDSVRQQNNVRLQQNQIPTEMGIRHRRNTHWVTALVTNRRINYGSVSAPAWCAIKARCAILGEIFLLYDGRLLTDVLKAISGVLEIIAAHDRQS